MSVIDKEIDIAARRTTAERMHALKNIVSTKTIEIMCWQSPRNGYFASAPRLFSFE